MDVVRNDEIFVRRWMLEYALREVFLEFNKTDGCIERCRWVEQFIEDNCAPASSASSQSDYESFDLDRYRFLIEFMFCLSNSGQKASGMLF